MHRHCYREITQAKEPCPLCEQESSVRSLGGSNKGSNGEEKKEYLELLKAKIVQDVSDDDDWY